MTRVGRFQHLSSGGLALLVHGFFFLALIFGMSWKNPPILPVEADLWVSLPEPPPARPVEPEHEVKPEVVPMPPVVESKPNDADIALEKAEKKKQEEAKKKEEARRLEEARLEQKREADARQAELDRQAERKRQAEEQLRQEQAIQEKARLEQEQREQAKQAAKRQMEQELARQMQDELDAEGAQLRAIQQRAKAGRDAVIINDYKHRIQSKIQSYVRLPQKLAGNPEAVFQVSLLPNGEVARVTLMKSSGQATYDAEVERAILKSSPLPLPRDKDAAAMFRDGLTLKFRPFDGGSEIRSVP